MKKIHIAFLVLFIAGDAARSMADPEAAVPQSPDQEIPASVEKQSDTRPRTTIQENLFFGGYINITLGSYQVIGIEPMLGYRFTPKFSAGIKARYDYIKDDRYAKSYTTSTYGGSVFGRYRITPNLYAQAEGATYNYETFFLSGGSERDWVPFLFAGGGFIQPLGERSWMNFQILFDVLQNDKSPYDDWEPFFSIGVGTGF